MGVDATGRWFLRRSGGSESSTHRLTLYWTGEPKVSVEFSAAGGHSPEAEQIGTQLLRRQIQLAIAALESGMNDPGLGTLRPD
jgi:hypothetical protein